MFVMGTASSSINPQSLPEGMWNWNGFNFAPLANFAKALLRLHHSISIFFHHVRCLFLDYLIQGHWE